MNPEQTNTEVQQTKIIKSSPSHLVLLFLVILGVAALSALGTYYYLLPQLKSTTPTLTPQYQQATDQSNTNVNNAQQVTPVTGNIQGMEGWKTIASSLAKFSLQYPSTWKYNVSTNNGGAEAISLISPNNFDLEITSFTSTSRYGQEGLKANPSGACMYCTVNNSETVTIPHYGNALLTTVTGGAGGGTINELMLMDSKQSTLLKSPIATDTYTNLLGVYQNQSQDQHTKESPSTFLQSADVQTAKQILKSLTY